MKLIVSILAVLLCGAVLVVDAAGGSESAARPAAKAEAQRAP